MIDIHCHLIYGVDNGPKTLEESLSMVNAAEKLGITTIIATPHYKSGEFDWEKTYYNYLEIVKRTINSRVALKFGCEVHAEPDLSSIIKDNRFITLNRSRHMLIDVPFDQLSSFENENTMYKLQLEGFIPIIAHPERSTVLANNQDKVLKYVRRDIMFQIDLASVTGEHGKKVKKFAKHLIKNNYAQFIASNAHCAEDYLRYNNNSNIYKRMYTKLNLQAGSRYLNEILHASAKDDLNYMDIPIS